MPFVSDIVGPQRPVPGGPVPVPGTIRRTSTIDTTDLDPALVATEVKAWINAVFSGCAAVVDLRSS